MCLPSGPDEWDARRDVSRVDVAVNLPKIYPSAPHSLLYPKRVRIEVSYAS